MYTYNVPSLNEDDPLDNYKYIFITMRGVFLALILFCASFLSPYIGCNYQYIMKTKPYIRYIILFLVIYFSIDLVDPNIKTIENPIYAIIRSLFVFLVFILLNNLPVMTLLTIMIFFSLLVVTSKYYSYYKQASLNVNENQRIHIDFLYIVQWVLIICIVILLLLSFFNKDKSNRSLILKECLN